MAADITHTRGSRRLLSTLLDNPDLPAFVRRLPARVLKRLIDHVGLEDAGALVEHVDAEQLRDLFEASLWHNLEPGAADTPKPGEFRRWLCVMIEHSPAFAAKRLRELGEAFVAAHLAPAIRVFDKGATVFMVQNDEWLEFDDHMVSIVDADSDDELADALTALYAEDADLIRHVLEACCYQPTPRGFADTDEIRQADEAFSRRERRERLGYVTPQIARAFLLAAQRTPLRALVAQQDYDGLSAAHFAPKSAADHGGRSGADRDHDADTPVDDAPPPDAKNLRALEAALIDARIVESDAPAGLLAGPRHATNEPMLKLQSAMDQLQWRDPDTFSARLGELIYLANVLMTGSWNRGASFEETDAARAALACANLGLDYVEQRAPDDSISLAALLARPPGLVRLFQIGWHLIQTLPRQAGAALVAALRDDDVQDRLEAKRWLLDEALCAIGEPDLLEQIARGEFEDVSDNLRLVSLIIDRRVCRCLELVISDVPRFPLQLNVGLRPGGRDVHASRYISNMRDVRKIHALLRELEAHIK